MARRSRSPDRRTPVACSRRIARETACASRDQLDAARQSQRPVRPSRRAAGRPRPSLPLSRPHADRAISSDRQPDGALQFRSAGWPRSVPEVPSPPTLPADPVQGLRARHENSGSAFTRARPARPGWANHWIWAGRSTFCIRSPLDSRIERSRVTTGSTDTEPVPARSLTCSVKAVHSPPVMSDSVSGLLAAGLKHSRSVTVTDDLTPAHLRQDPIRVLSTPDMIRLVEQTAIEAVAPHLAPGQTTVGTRVDIAHLAATPVGMTVTITVELTEVDRRRLAFRRRGARPDSARRGRQGHPRALHHRRRAAPAPPRGQAQALEGRLAADAPGAPAYGPTCLRASSKKTRSCPTILSRAAAAAS